MAPLTCEVVTEDGLEYEVNYRRHIQSTTNLVVAFFEHAEDFPRALDTVRQQLAEAHVRPDKACILYRTRCESEAPPRWRVWSRPVPFEALQVCFPPRPPWVGLDCALKRPMRDEECRRFFDERRYDVLELRVSTLETVPASSPGSSSGVASSSSSSGGYLQVASTVTSSSGMLATRSKNR